jgi:release factor glutamine methyltransferase
MTLKGVFDLYHTSLKGINDEQETAAIFYIVAEHVSGFSRSHLLSRLNDTISAEEKDQYVLVLKRLVNQEPLQYILAEAYFYGLKLKVSDAVLIPRPETEELVEMIENVLAPKLKPYKVLDIGTGSGCIAISLKHRIPLLDVSALDISADALSIAAHNSIMHAAKITLIRADIRTYSSQEKFDVIISNPPYITQTEALSMDRNVMGYEPHLALFVADQNPLEFYTAIANFAEHNLMENGLLFFEINANFGRETSQMLIDRSFEEVQVIKDMQGKDRFISAKKLN